MKDNFNPLTAYIAKIDSIGEGKRNVTLYHTGLHLCRSFGLHGENLAQCLREVNLAKCKPPLEDGEIKNIARSVEKIDSPIGSLLRSADEYLVKEISTFASATTKQSSETVTVRQFLDDCKNGKYQEQIKAIRTEEDKERRATLKKKLPAVTIQSDKCEQRKREFCTNNAIVCLDFDGIENIENAKQAIAAVPYVLAVCTSASGHGIFALVALAEPVESLKPILESMRTDFEFTIDMSCSDISRLRFVTYDPDLILKDSVIPYGGKRDEIPEKIGIDILDSFLQQIERIPFGETEREKITLSTYYIDSIDELLNMAKEHNWDIGIKNYVPYFYSGQFWQRIEKDNFRHFLQLAGTRQGIPRRIIRDHAFVKKLVMQFESVTHFPVLNENDMPKINLRNGTLHFTPDGAEMKPFDKRDGLTYQLNYDFDPSATAPIFKKFLDRVLHDKAVRKLLFQYIGYIFLRNMNLEKILFLYGGGANGKSVFLNVIKALVGSEQCSAFSLEGITKHDYQRAELGNYLLNISTEISTRLGTSVFKQIASREPLPARSPYGRPFNVHNYATSIFAANELPRDTEQTKAFFRRFIIIPFDVRIPDEEQDSGLARKIIDSEMSGVLNYVVKGVKSLLTSGQFDIPPAIQNIVEKFRQESDSVLTFLEENKYRPSSEHFKSLQEMYDDYKEQCKDDGSRGGAKRNFSKRLRDLDYEIGQIGHKKETVVYAERAE